MHMKKNIPNVTSVVILTSDSGRTNSSLHRVHRTVIAESVIVITGTRARVQKRARRRSFAVGMYGTAIPRTESASPLRYTLHEPTFSNVPRQWKPRSRTGSQSHRCVNR